MPAKLLRQIAAKLDRMVVALAPSSTKVSGDIVAGGKRQHFQFDASTKSYAQFVADVQSRLEALGADMAHVDFDQSPLAVYLQRKAPSTPLMSAFIGRFVDKNFHDWDRASFIRRMDTGMQHGGTLGTNQKLYYGEDEKSFIHQYKPEMKEWTGSAEPTVADVQQFVRSKRGFAMERGVIKPGDVYVTSVLA